MYFQHLYKVKKDDTWFKIARRFGFDSPAPITNFPPNLDHYWDGTEGPGRMLRIPYHPTALRNFIDFCTRKEPPGLLLLNRQDKKKLLNGAYENKNELEDTLRLLDVIGFCATMCVGLASMSVNMVKQAGPRTVKDLASWLGADRALMAANIASLTLPIPGAPKIDLRFWLRHHPLNWFSPSYHGSILAGIWSMDLDLILYGHGAIAEREIETIGRVLDQAYDDLEKRVGEAEYQLISPFYSELI
jgi:hypothetical protein